MGGGGSTPAPPVIMATEASVRSDNGFRIIEINLDANQDGHSVSTGSIIFIIVATLVMAWLIKLAWRKARKYRLNINRNVLPLHAPNQFRMAQIGPQPAINAAAAPGTQAPENVLPVPQLNI